MDYDTLHDQLQIDRFSLDDELVKQAELYHHASEQFALSESQRDEAKEKLELVAAELDQKMRANWEKYNKDSRLTETSLAATMKQQKKYKEAQEHYQKKRKESAVWRSLKEAYHQRGYMLRELVTLFVSDYFQRDNVQATTHVAQRGKAEQGKQAMTKKRKESTKRRKMQNPHGSSENNE